jgi:hypothetical protein
MGRDMLFRLSATNLFLLNRYDRILHYKFVIRLGISVNSFDQMTSYSRLMEIKRISVLNITST